MEAKELIEYYKLGVNDELNFGREPKLDSKQKNIAYKLGRTHALLGCEIKDFNDLREREITETINFEFKKLYS